MLSSSESVSGVDDEDEEEDEEEVGIPGGVSSETRTFSLSSLSSSFPFFEGEGCSKI